MPPVYTYFQGELRKVSYSQFFTGHIHWERGEPARAIQTMSECIRLAEQAGFAVPQFGTRADLGWVYASLGAIERGLEFAQAARRIAERFPVCSSWPFAILARLYLLDGDVTAAERVLQQAHTITRPDYLANLYPTYACGLAFADIELALARKEDARAVALADQLIPFLEGGRMLTFLPDFARTGG